MDCCADFRSLVRNYNLERSILRCNVKLILDACCGSRMFWFDKHNPAVTYMDKRNPHEFDTLCMTKMKACTTAGRMSGLHIH